MNSRARWFNTRTATLSPARQPRDPADNNKNGQNDNHDGDKRKVRARRVWKEAFDAPVVDGRTSQHEWRENAHVRPMHSNHARMVRGYESDQGVHLHNHRLHVIQENFCNMGSYGVHPRPEPFTRRRAIGHHRGDRVPLTIHVDVSRVEHQNAPGDVFNRFKHPSKKRGGVSRHDDVFFKDNGSGVERDYSPPYAPVAQQATCSRPGSELHVVAASPAEDVPGVERHALVDEIEGGIDGADDGDIRNDPSSLDGGDGVDVLVHKRDKETMANRLHGQRGWRKKWYAKERRPKAQVPCEYDA